MRWVEPDRLPKDQQLRQLYDDFAIVKNGKDGRPKRLGCPPHFDRLTMSWYLNDPKPGESPNVKCDENYEFWALRDIKEGEELTVDSRTYSDHAASKPASPIGSKSKKGKR
jgi:hypothetical protein